MSGAGHEAGTAGEERAGAHVFPRAERRAASVGAHAVGGPLRAGRGVGEVVDAAPLEHPGSFDPAVVRVGVAGAHALPRVVRRVRLEHRGGVREQARRVGGVELDAGDLPAAAEVEVEAAVVVGEEHRVARAELRAVGRAQRADVLERPERRIRDVEIRVEGEEPEAAAVLHDRGRVSAVVGLHAPVPPRDEVLAPPDHPAGGVEIPDAGLVDHGRVGELAPEEAALRRVAADRVVGDGKGVAVGFHASSEARRKKMEAVQV